MKAKVLLVEDDLSFVRFYKEMLAGRGLRILGAREIAIAEEILTRHPDIAVVVVDGELADTGSIRETCQFIRRVRASGYSGVMIAASSNASWRRRLVRAGCDCNAGEKQRVPRKVIHVVDQRPINQTPAC